MKAVKILLIASILIYLSLLLAVYLNQRDMLYHPGSKQNNINFYKLSNTKEIALITDDQLILQAWYRPSQNKKMVIFLHGNAGNIENRVSHLKELMGMDYGFIIPAWRGFGDSEGTATKAGLFLDAEAAIKFLKDKKYKLDEVIIIGESLGTGVAVEMSLRHKFKGLFLITPYTSIADRAGEIYPFLPTQFFTKDNFKVLDNIDKINQPLLMIHGDQDKVVPHHHSEKIFAKANEPKKLIIYPGAGHTNYNIKKAFLAMDKFFR